MRTYGTLAFYPPDRTFKGRWLLTAEPHVTTRLKRIFPRLAPWVSGELSLVATPEVARDLEWVLERWPLDVDDDTAKVLAEQANLLRGLEDQTARVFNGERLDGEWRIPAREARWSHQDMNADLITLQRRLVICDTLGGGKTHSGLLALRNPDSLPALVVVQSHLQRQWREECALTWPDLYAHIIRKSSVYDIAATRESKGRNPHILICTYPKLAGWADHLVGHVRTVIFDEIQEVRREHTQKNYAAQMIADEAEYVVGLSGTPVMNYGGDMFNIMSIVKNDVLGGRDEFHREWCNQTSNGKSIVRDPAALGSHLRSVGAMVISQLPVDSPPIKVTHLVDSDEKAFDTAAGDAAEMARFILSQEGTKEERWHASGEFDMRMRQATGIAKASFVAGFVKLLLEDVNKVVLWGWHRAVYDIWTEALAAHNPVLYTGSESPTQKQRSLDRFRDGNSNVFIMSLRSGTGLNGLEGVCHVGVFGELDWSPGAMNQAIGRLDRPGQEHPPVIAYFLTSNEGADPTMLDVLGVKTQQAEPMINPDLERFAPVDTSDRVRQLARDVLTRGRHLNESGEIV